MDGRFEAAVVFATEVPVIGTGPAVVSAVPDGGGFDLGHLLPGRVDDLQLAFAGGLVLQLELDLHCTPGSGAAGTIKSGLKIKQVNNPLLRHLMSGKEGDKFKAGKLGEFTDGKDAVFNSGNIDQFSF